MNSELVKGTKQYHNKHRGTVMQNCCINTQWEDNGRKGLFDWLLLIAISYNMLSLSRDWFNYIAFTLYVIIVFLGISRRNKSLITITDKDLAISLFIYRCSILVHGLIGAPVGTYIAKQVIMSFILFSPIMLFNYSVRYFSRKTIRWLLNGIGITTIILAVYSIIYYDNNSGAARHMSEYEDVVGGGYALAVMCSVLSVYLFEVLLSQKRRVSRRGGAMIVISQVVFMLLIVKTQSTTTLICWIVGVMLCLFSAVKNKIKNTQMRVLFMFAAGCICVALAVIVLPLIGTWLINLSTSRDVGYALSKRLLDFGYFLRDGSGSGEYSVNRMMIPLTSLKTFFEHPLFGVAYKHGIGYYRPFLYGVGNHCEFPDMLANYGLLGGLPILFVFFKGMTNYRSRIRGNDYCRVWVIETVLLACFNPFRSFQALMTIFFFIPMCEILQNSESGHIRGDRNTI